MLCSTVVMHSEDALKFCQYDSRAASKWLNHLDCNSWNGSGFEYRYLNTMWVVLLGSICNSYLLHLLWRCSCTVTNEGWWYTRLLLCNLLHNKVVHSATMPNAAATKCATNMASCDTDNDDLISAMLLGGAIANMHKIKRPEFIKEVSGHMNESNSIRDMVFTTTFFTNSCTFNSVHSILISKASKQRINYI